MNANKDILEVFKIIIVSLLILYTVAAIVAFCYVIMQVVFEGWNYSLIWWILFVSIYVPCMMYFLKPDKDDKL